MDKKNKLDPENIRHKGKILVGDKWVEYEGETVRDNAGMKVAAAVYARQTKTGEECHIGDPYEGQNDGPGAAIIAPFRKACEERDARNKGEKGTSAE